jgi:hypothetical protein
MSTVVTFPSSGAYVDALQDTRRCFVDPELTGCTVRTDRFGLPRPISGNFASVFTADTTSGRRLAIKCFTRDVPDQQARFREIEAALRDVPARWKVEFRYVETGVLVQGRPYPVLVMEWIEAKQLISWIEDRLRTGDRVALGRLAEGFAQLVASLEAAGLAHGDLQHGNLLVTARGELKLIDYDGMYVPALSGRPARELGQPNYQHPRRSASDYGPWLDRFSARVIHLSLAALAADPTLWYRLHKPGGEFLLLQKYDLEDPASSPALASLGALGAQFRARAEELAEAVRMPLDAIAPLDEAASGKTGAAVPAQAPETEGGLGPATRAGVSWLDDHLPPPAPVLLNRPSWAARLAWYISLLAICALGSVTAYLALPAVGGCVAFIGLIVAGWWIRFLRTPEARARRERRKALRAARAQEKHIEAQLRWQIAAREESIATYQRELGALAARRAQIDGAAVAEYARIDRWRDEELAKLVRERTELQTWKSAELARRISSVEARHVAGELARHRIDAAQIYGIGRAVVAELDAAGVRTAADFLGIRIERGFGRSTSVRVLHRDGRALKVPMVGEVRARQLDAWRAGLAGRANVRMPAQLTAAIRAQIDRELAAKQAGISARESAIRSAADVQRKTAQGQTQAQREQLVADEQSTRSSHAAAIVAIDRDCAVHREGVSAAQHRSRVERRALDAYRAVHFRGYVRMLTFGGS